MVVENVLTYNGLVLIELTIVVQIHMMLPKKGIGLFIRAKAGNATAHQYSLSYTKSIKICG